MGASSQTPSWPRAPASDGEAVACGGGGIADFERAATPGRPFFIGRYSAKIPCRVSPAQCSIGRKRMLTRRGFAGVAGCAICSLAGFSATEAFAQASAPTTANGVTRQILSRTDGPTAGYETIIMDVKIDKGAAVARHTHPGIESTYVMEGS